MASARAVDLDPVELGLRRGPPEARSDQNDLVAARREPTEDLVQVDLGTPGDGVLQVLPVQDEDPQSRSSPSARRRRASSTPFTKRGDSSPP